MHRDIKKYNAAQSDDARAICHALAEGIDEGLQGVESKVWHGGPQLLRSRGVLEKLGDWQPERS